MGGPKYISTMDQLLLDLIRRVEKLERRKHHKAYSSQTVQVGQVPVGGVIILPPGSHLVDNGDGTYTVVEGS